MNRTWCLTASFPPGPTTTSYATTTFSLLELELKALVQVYGLLLVPCVGAKNIKGTAGCCEAVHHGWICRSSAGAGARVHVPEDLCQGTQPAVQLHLLGLQDRVLRLQYHKVLAGYAQCHAELLVLVLELIYLF